MKSSTTHTSCPIDRSMHSAELQRWGGKGGIGLPTIHRSVRECLHVVSADHLGRKEWVKKREWLGMEKFSECRSIRENRPRQVPPFLPLPLVFLSRKIRRFICIHAFLPRPLFPFHWTDYQDPFLANETKRLSREYFPFAWTNARFCKQSIESAFLEAHKKGDGGPICSFSFSLRRT